jgi:hypothetical protein
LVLQDFCWRRRSRLSKTRRCPPQEAQGHVQRLGSGVFENVGESRLASIGVTRIPFYSRKPAAARNASSAGCRAGCRPNRTSPRSPRSCQPLSQNTVCARAQRPLRGRATVEPGSAFIPYGRPLEDAPCVQKDRHVGRDNCVQRKACPCRSRNGATATNTSRPPCVCANIPAVPCPFSTGRAASPASVKRANRSLSLTGRLTPLGAPGLWTCARRFAGAATEEADI